MGPLHFVALGNNIQLAKWLLANGATFEFNDEGETPLHWACRAGSEPMISLFLQHMTRAQIIQRDFDTLTAFDWAKEYECKFAIEALSVYHSSPKLSPRLRLIKMLRN